jgi:hypothetical protein
LERGFSGSEGFVTPAFVLPPYRDEGRGRSGPFRQDDRRPLDHPEQFWAPGTTWTGHVHFDKAEDETHAVIVQRLRAG